MSTGPKEITLLLRQWGDGDQDAGAQLFELLQPDLRKLAARCLRRERLGHTVQKSDLVNECFIKLLRANNIDWRDRGHFFAIVTVKMRRFLIDYARKRVNYNPVSLDDVPPGLLGVRKELETALMIDKLLDELEKESPTKCSVVVFISYLGMSTRETAEKLNMTEAAVEHEWRRARIWLFKRLNKA